MVVSDVTNTQARMILNRARHGGKYDYNLYNSFKRELESVGLSAQEYQRAVIQLAKILRV